MRTTINVASLTTHPSTPFLEFEFSIKKPYPQKLEPLMIKDADAAAFSLKFLEPGHWSIKRHQEGLVATSNSEKQERLLLQDYSNLAKWRTIDISLQSIGAYRLDKTMLDRLSHWKTEHANTPKFMRRAFPSILEVQDMDETIDLVFPNDNGERRSLGASKSKLDANGPANYQSKISNKRYFDIKQVNQLIELALDYRIHFEFELLESHQGVSAIKFHIIDLPFKASITMPLMLSVKGNPTEITR